MARRSGDYVLIVDDDEEVTSQLGDILENHGYRAACSSDGLDALEQMEGNGPPSLILLDLEMQGMDGWALLQELKRMPEVASVPVVILSAHSDFVGPRLSLSLRKPVDVDRLLTLVSMHLERTSS